MFIFLEKQFCSIAFQGKAVTLLLSSFQIRFSKMQKLFHPVNQIRENFKFSYFFNSFILFFPCRVNLVKKVLRVCLDYR